MCWTPGSGRRSLGPGIIKVRIAFFGELCVSTLRIPDVRRYERMEEAKFRNADALRDANASNCSTHHESPSQEVENRLQHNRRESLI